MLFLGIIAGWIVLSCVAAPLVGQFISTNVAEREDAGLEKAAPLYGATTR